MSRRWINRPDGSNWGDFGDDDQIGRLNLLTPERVQLAANEIKTGENFCLSLPLNIPVSPGITPNRKAPKQHFIKRKENRAHVNYPLNLEKDIYTDVVCDDHITLFTQYSTQWDSLAHVGSCFDADGDGEAEMVYYNGFRAGVEIVEPSDNTEFGARALGVEHMAAASVQGRGVLVDLHSRFGDRPEKVTLEMLLNIMSDDGLFVEAGDLLCLHTGYADYLLNMADDPAPKDFHGKYSALDGQDSSLLNWLDRSGVSALIADNVAVEAYPNEAGGNCPGPGLPLHEACIFKLGIPLGELWYLTELSDWLKNAGRYRFFLTCPPLRLPGAFGSPVTPVATV